MKKLLPFFRPYLWRIILTIALLLTSTFLAAYEPIWFKRIFNAVSDPNRTMQLVLTPLISYFVFRAVSAVAQWLRDLIAAPAQVGIGNDLSLRLYNHLLSLPVAYHAEQKTGAAAKSITRGANALRFVLDYMTGTILPTIFQLVFSLWILFSNYQIAYGLITFAAIVLYTTITIIGAERRGKIRAKGVDADDAAGALEVETLTHIETIKLFNAEPDRRAAYGKVSTDRFGFNTQSYRVFSTVSFLQNLTLIAAVLALFGLAIKQIFDGILTAGDLVLLSTYVGQLAGPISSLAFVYFFMKDSLVNLQKSMEILEAPVTITDPIKPTSPKKLAGGVQLDGVTHSYENGRTVSDNITLSIKPGERVAFVGPSGAGKSTLVKLLFRLMDPETGAISIDGVDLKALSSEDRSKLLAIVPQEPALFHSSIRENILFGNPGASEKELAQAITIAQLDGLISKLPEGLDTVVGERGVKLSGGERQRVAIARAVIRNPKIMVFDEATSSLDTATEQQILGALDAAAKGRTTIAIAHRLSTVVKSDTIYVLENGAITESGTHQQLLSRKGTYAELWNRQINQHEETEASAA